jgi:hypothetical protein
MRLCRIEARSDEKETGRVEAFSDGVFGIAITLGAEFRHGAHYVDQSPQDVPVDSAQRSRLPDD